MIYDDNKISIEDDTNIAFSEDVAKRYEAYGWHVQEVDWTNGGDRYREDVQALYDAHPKAEAVTDQPSFIRLRTIIAWPAPNAQNTGKAHGSALGADEVAATKKVLGFDPEQTFEVADDVIEHTRGLVERGKAEQAAWQEEFDAWAAQARRRPRTCSTGCRRAPCPAGWADALPTFDADEKGVATREASGDVLNARRPRAARAVGRVRRPGRLQQHHAQGRAALRPARAGRPRCSAGDEYGRRVLHFGIREHAHGRDPQRHRAARRHPGRTAARS